MKLKQLLTTQECPMKATLRYQTDTTSFDISGQKNQLAREIFTSDIKDLSELKSVDLAYLDDKFPDLLFASSREKKGYIRKILSYVDTFMLRLTALEDRNLIQKVNGTVNMTGEQIDVSIDMILEDDDTVDLINLKLTEAKIKAGGRKEETKIEYSIELYLMYLLGEQLYPEKNVRASLAYLKEPFKSKNFLATRTSVSDKDETYFNEKIGGLLATNRYEENCNQSNCRMCEFKRLCMYTHNLEVLPESEISVDIDETKVLPTISYTEEQEDVILFEEGIGITNAVAGSGKTATITKRLARLLKEKGENMEDILVLSFSEKTIDEFKEKLAKHHGIIDFENIFTFNGFGDKILVENYGLFGFKKEPRLINQVEKMDTIKEVLDSSLELTELNDINSIWNTRDCVISSIDYSNPFMRNGKNLGIAFNLEKLFNKIKLKGLNYSKEEFITEEILTFEKNVDESDKLTEEQKDFLIDKYETFLEKLYGMYESYDFMLKSKGLYDYSDQVNYLVYSLTHPRLKDIFNYKHIICDEFQDSNNLSMYILRRLTVSKEFKSLLVVGDINQSIYGFLGTTPENLLTFEKRFVDKVHKFDLSYSFRVPDKVAKGANALMNSSYQVKYNQMRAFRKDPGIISTFKDIETLVNSIKSTIAEDKTVGIIATTNMDLNIFIDMLVSNDIPYVVKSNLDVMKKDKVANLLSLSKFFANPENHTLEYAKYLQIADYEEFSKHFRTDSFNDYFKVKLDEILDRMDLKNPIELLEIYFELLSELATHDYMIETFANHLQRQRFKSIYDANDYCQKMDVYALEVKAQENNVDCNVIVTTAHSSKGREFDMVIMDTSTFRARSEEDRRLFYVAMTRAKESLYFIDVERKGEDKKDCGAFLEAITKSLNS